MVAVALATTLLMDAFGASVMPVKVQLMGDAVQGLAGPADSVPGRTPDEWSTFMATQRRRTILIWRGWRLHPERG